MRYINVFYVFVVIVGVVLWKMNTSFRNDVVLFYGFAENKETEINFNYPTAVGKIYVTPGQRVKEGEPLLDLYRIKSKEVLDDEQFKIDELDSRNNLWAAQKQSDINIFENQKAIEISGIEADILKLEKQRDFQKSLYEDLESLDSSIITYQPLTNKINELKKEKMARLLSYNEKINKIRKEIQLEGNTYQIKKNRIIAEKEFEDANRIIHNQLVAPSDGIIGNLHCKEEEHIPSYKTLVTFYDPNPNLVKGYVHEDLIVHVSLNDSFEIRSRKNKMVSCSGKVVGLGSRIVEIPERLRKMPDLKTYGREILVSIPERNNFLQKEKVVLQFINPPKGLKEPVRNSQKNKDLTEKLKQ